MLIHVCERCRKETAGSYDIVHDTVNFRGDYCNNCHESLSGSMNLVDSYFKVLKKELTERWVAGKWLNICEIDIQTVADAILAKADK